MAVTWTDQASGVRGLHNIAVNLVETKVPVDEQKEYRAIIESLSAQQPLEVVTLNLVTGICNVAMRSLAIGAEVSFPTGDVPAERYDEVERIPMIGVVRRGRGGPHNAKIRPSRQERHQLTREYDALKPKLKEVSQLYKAVKSRGKWREIVRAGHEWLPDDIIEMLADPDHVRYVPSNLAIELAARRSINDYKPFSVSPERLKKLRGR